MSGRQRLCGTVDLSFELEGRDIEIFELPFGGWYEYDPGVRYYADGSGEPPSSDSSVERDWDDEELLRRVVAEMEDDDYGEPVLVWLEKAKDQLPDLVDRLLEEKVLDDVDSFLFDPEDIH